MGQFVRGNTRPVTGWRDWKKRLGPHLGSHMSGAYTPATFPLPTITPQSFWGLGDYRRADFPVPQGTRRRMPSRAVVTRGDRGPASVVLPAGMPRLVDSRGRALAGTFETEQVLEQPSKWGLQSGLAGPFDDTLAWVEQNAGKILAGSLGLLLLVGGVKRRRRR